jgi:hypothetical protein
MKYRFITETYWIIRELRPNTKYSFRVRSRNSYGDSNWSPASALFDSSEQTLRNERKSGIKDLLSLGLPLLMALCLCLISVIGVFTCGNFLIFISQ